jgi:hypothetical protein
MQNFDLHINPNHAMLTFKCKYVTSYGDELRIVGNIEELGRWDPTKALLMITNNESYPIWTSTQDITGPVGMEIFYKYIIYNPSNNSYKWEELENNDNRKHIIASSGMFIINDEESSLNSYVQKTNQHDCNKYMNYFHILDDKNYLSEEEEEEKKNIIPFYESIDYNSLSYDVNQLHGNDLNETLMFCLNVI